MSACGMHWNAEESIKAFRKQILSCGDPGLPSLLCECDQLHPKCINVITCFSEGKMASMVLFESQKFTL